MHTRPFASFGGSVGVHSPVDFFWGECWMHTRPRCLKLFVEGVLVYTRPVPRQFLRILDSSWLNLKFGCFLTNSSWLNVKFRVFLPFGGGCSCTLARWRQLLHCDPLTS